MNERIKLLAKQAGLKIEYQMINPPKPLQIIGSTEQFEKFAELIVKDCAIIANRAENTETEIRCMYDVITEHFGVEE